MNIEQRLAVVEQFIIQQKVIPTTETDRRLNRLENKVDHLRIDLDGLRTDVNNLGQRVDRLEVKVDRLEIKVDQLRVDVDGLRIDVNNLGQRVDQLEIKVDRLEVKVNQLEVKVDQLEVKVDKNTQAIERLEKKMDDGFKQLSNQISSLGSRWGIYNESIWRQTIASVLGESYGVTVKRLELSGEEFDVLISNGDHILIEITSRFHQRDVNKVIRKRQLYTDQTQAPSRFIVAAASIHNRVAQQLIGLGFEVIEPDED